VALDDVTVRFMLLRVTVVGLARLLPVIVTMLVVRLATALLIAGTFAKARCEKDEDRVKTLMSRVVLKC